uniref:Uncharacterized protein n=1 Tax=Timema bartmani TaxID=61472 RepID=A0A7R9I671_9NEOP|nr:unnamed protein product [Timema bartmani]
MKSQKSHNDEEKITTDKLSIGSAGGAKCEFITYKTFALDRPCYKVPFKNRITVHASSMEKSFYLWYERINSFKNMGQQGGLHRTVIRTSPVVQRIHIEVAIWDQLVDGTATTIHVVGQVTLRVERVKLFSVRMSGSRQSQDVSSFSNRKSNIMKRRRFAVREGVMRV